MLRGVSPTLCAPYLEAALAAHVASRETYETELAVMYLQALLEGGPGPAGAPTEPHAQVSGSGLAIGLGLGLAVGSGLQ